MKKSISIRTKIASCFALLMLLLIISQIVFNVFLLKPYFTYTKKKVIEKAFYEISENYTGSTSDIDELANSLQNTHSIKLILFDENGIIYTTGFANNQQFLPPADIKAPDSSTVKPPEQSNSDKSSDDKSASDNSDNSDNSTQPPANGEREMQIPGGAEFTEVPTISTVDRGMGDEQELQLTGKFDCDGVTFYVLLTLPMESIESSVALFTKVSAVISAAVLAIGIVIAVILSNSLTRPIKSVEQVAKSLSDLDFSKLADENVTTSELASLAKSINAMSVKLKNSIDELQIANDNLKKDIDYKNKIEQMRRQFIANVSHEMKTPLGLLQIYCANLKNNINGVDKEYYCDVIIEETEKLNDMVISMLDISSIESGLSKMEFADTDISAAARETAAKFITAYDECEFDADIDDSLTVSGDLKHIEQAMNNYISNAVTHTENGEKIKISLKKEGNRAVFSVENAGKAIADEDIEHLWDPFYKSDKARTRTQNNVGLGLYIVKTIIEKHMGEYGVENTQNGVRFYFSLPLAPNKIAEENPKNLSE